MGDKSTRTPLLTPQNVTGAGALESLLATQMDPNNRFVLPDFSMSKNFTSMLDNALAGKLAGVPEGVLDRLTSYATGEAAPFTNDALINDILAKAEQQGTLTYEQKLAEAGAAGSPFSSASRAAAVNAASMVNLEGRIAAAKERAQQVAQNLQLEQQSTQLLIGASEAALRLGVTAEQLRAAVLQFEAGLSWEEWKQRNPGAYQVAAALWGRNVDFVGQQEKSWIGPAITAVGAILAPMTGGASLAAAAAAAAAANQQGK